MNPNGTKNSGNPSGQPAPSRPPGGPEAVAKQQIIERVKQANNVLVTVSTNPSVDQLAACIGLTLLLNRMDKHATAVFSGKAPSTIEFLQPEKTLETNTDSLRDFIISLDKAKADKLRYKVEDQVVRIFITPYKTSLSENDLIFSQGDFNVDAVMALGVHDRSQLDAAITNHGRILHDATVISLNAGPGNAPRIGQINWQEPTASSLSEMLVSISEAFGGNLIDSQIATAFLTGIVAETNRFSNKKTSPKVMTMSAQLMAAGANQQLIVSKLEPPPPPPPPKQLPKKPSVQAARPVPPAKKKEVGVLSVSHEPAKKDSPEVEVDPNEIRIDNMGNIKTAEEIKAELENQKPAHLELPPEIDNVAVEAPPALAPELPPMPLAPGASPIPTITKNSQQPMAPLPPPVQVPPQKPPGPHELLNPLNDKPVFGTSFSNNTGNDQASQTWSDPYNTVPIDPVNAPNQHEEGTFQHSHVVQPPPPHGTPLNELLQREAQREPGQLLTPAPVPSPDMPLSAEAARQNVESVYGSQPFNPAGSPQVGIGSAPLGEPLHDSPPPMPFAPTPPTATPTFNLPGGGNGNPPPPPSPPPPPPFPPPPFPGGQPPQQPNS